MRVLFLGNNWVAWQIALWLREQGEEIVGLVLHAPDRRKYEKEIISAAGVAPAQIFDGTRLTEAEALRAIAALRPHIGISALFGYILRPEFLDLLPAGCVNVHPALLPYNRGEYPNIWSIVEGTPAGATLHYIDAGIDTGDIIAQSEVPVEPIDTGESLYHKLEEASVALFKETWPLIRSARHSRTPQVPRAGTYHRVRDVERIDEIELDRTYSARQLIDILRARTFPPYQGAYFWHNRRKVYLRLQLSYDDDGAG